MRWAVAKSRSEGQPEGETPLVTTLTDAYDVTETLRNACQVYLGREAEECIAQELHWLNASHFWALPFKPSPRTMRGLARFYTDHGMELAEGDEDLAQADYEEARERNDQLESYRARADRSHAEAGMWKEKCAVLQRKHDRMQADFAYATDAQTLKAYQAKIANLEHIVSIKTEENERLSRTLQSKASR